MKTLNSIAVVALAGITLVASPWCSGAEADPPTAGKTAPAPVYTVAKYDPNRDPAEDLKSTVQQAGKGNKRILLVVGGDWCSWCHLMADYFKDNPKVASALARDFVIMKVNMSTENRNEKFLAAYPQAQGYPHIFVLESDGTFLHSQGTAVLEEGRGYNEKAVLGFLGKWAPAKGD